ncbi:MAG: hypothetical protein JW958_13405 [Candidatus Eisenbacteria bacterium]|nr:hypothetical protein [Candidatus Eisenbacteria bacterium]
MRRFQRILREIDGKLDLPQPAKSRIILEMAADLEDLFDVYVARGEDEEGAVRLVEERFAVTEEAIAELIRIHENPLRRFMRGLSEQARSRWERAALAALLLFLVAFAGRGAVSARFFTESSVFIWPVLGLSFVVAALSAAKAYALWIRADHAPRRLRSGLGTLLALTGANLLVGFFGAAAESRFSAEKAARDAGNASYYLAEYLLRVCPMLIAGLLAALFTAILWYVLTLQVERIETAAASALLGDRPAV